MIEHITNITQYARFLELKDAAESAIELAEYLSDFLSQNRTLCYETAGMESSTDELAEMVIITKSYESTADGVLASVPDYYHRIMREIHYYNWITLGSIIPDEYIDAGEPHEPYDYKDGHVYNIPVLGLDDDDIEDLIECSDAMSRWYDSLLESGYGV